MAKKWKKRTLPKRIAGVKVPKSLRKGVGKLMATQTGRTIAAEALTAAAAVLAANLASGKGRRALSRIAEADVPGGAISAGSALQYALGEGVRSFSEALQRGKAMADAKAAWPALEEAEPEAAASKKKSKTGEPAVTH